VIVVTPEEKVHNLGGLWDTLSLTARKQCSGAVARDELLMEKEPDMEMNFRSI